MKVYIVTANDIEDHSPIKVFEMKANAEEFNDRERQNQKERFYAGRTDRHSHIEWKDTYYYGEVMEFEIE